MGIAQKKLTDLRNNSSWGRGYRELNGNRKIKKGKKRDGSSVIYVMKPLVCL